MFTGIVEEIGTLESITPQPTGEARLLVRGPLAASDARLGDSIAVDGVCLTVVDLPGDGTFAVDAVPETLRRTALGRREAGSRVNLERALRADARLGGHIVQGHVDGVGTLRSRTGSGRWEDLVIAHDGRLAPLIAEKGAITVSGVSLTVTEVADDAFGLSLIPATLEATTLGALGVGDEVNLEVDVLARYVARLQAFPATAASDAASADGEER
ncbi:riboflavin synthase [Brachybacterium sp. DNPG3]